MILQYYMKTQTLSKSDIKDINANLSTLYNIEPLSKKNRVVKVTSELGIFIKVNNELQYFYIDNKIIPLLKLLQTNNFLKTISVDMGAIKFVVSGADIMRPGIVEINDSIAKDDIIAIVDQNNKKPLAIGVALDSAENLQIQEKGKSVKTIHWIGDKIWEAQF